MDLENRKYAATRESTSAGRDAATWTSKTSKKMRKYAPFLTVLAAAAAPYRHRGRDRDYWNVEDPDRLYGPLRAEPFEALGVACKRTAVRLTRATATKEGLADAEDCLDALQASYVIDETQLSLELYFYARELNRADHVRLGLAPPGTGLLPPGEADVFAARGEAR